MGAITFSIDAGLVQSLVKLTELDTFVETGTYQGGTVATVRPYFQHVISIEREEELFHTARARFADDPGVTLLQGDSAQVLGNLMGDIQTRKVLFWLDAHWYGGKEQKEERDPCPLLAELHVIHRLNQDSLILIDDARFFLAPPTAPQSYNQWPRFQELLIALQALSSQHRLLVLNDVIIFYPPILEESLYAFAHEQGVDWLKIAQMAQRCARVIQDNFDKKMEIQRLTDAIRERQAFIDRRFSPYYWGRRIFGLLHHRVLDLFRHRKL